MKQLTRHFIFVFAVLNISGYDVQAQRLSCDSILALENKSPLMLGMKAACADEAIVLFNPPFMKQSDCCAWKYYSDHGVFCVFDTDSGLSEKEKQFNQQYREGYNRVMMQRVIPKLGENYAQLSSATLTGKLTVNEQLANELKSLLVLKPGKNGTIHIQIKNNPYPKLDSAWVLCSFDSTRFRLQNLYEGITVNSKISANGEQRFVVLYLDFSSLNNTPDLCMCDSAWKWSYVLEVPLKRKSRRMLKHADH